MVNDFTFGSDKNTKSAMKIVVGKQRAVQIQIERMNLSRTLVFQCKLICIFVVYVAFALLPSQKLHNLK